MTHFEFVSSQICVLLNTLSSLIIGGGSELEGRGLLGT